MASQTPDDSTGKRRRRRWPWITAGVVAIVIVAAGVIGANAKKSGGNDSASSSAAPVSTSATPSPAAPSPPPSSSVTAAPTSASPSVPPPVPSAPESVQALRAAFQADHAGQPWFAKVTSVDLDGRAVVGRSTLEKGDQAAVSACEALRSSAAKSAVDFQSVAVRDARDRTLAHWSRLAGDSACTA